jgi:hypothetical protein
VVSNRICSLDNREDRAIWKAIDDFKSKADRILKDHSLALVAQYWDEGATPKGKQIIDHDFTEAQRAWDCGEVEWYLKPIF